MAQTPRDPETVGLNPNVKYRYENGVGPHAPLGKPAYLLDMHADTAPKPVYDKMDTDLDRDAVIGSQPIPEVSPALGGLRKKLLEVRIDHRQDKIERFAQDRVVLEFVRDKIKSGKAYSDSESARTNKPIPTSRKQLRAANKLERLERRRRNLIGVNHDLVMPIDPKRVEPGPKDGDRFPSLLTQPKVGSRQHLAHIRGVERRDTRLRRRVRTLDKRIDRIVQRPVDKAQKAIGKRDRFVRRHEAITRAQAAAAAKRSSS